MSYNPGEVYVPGYGSSAAKIFIVGEAPGAGEESHNPPRPFVGPTGKELDKALELAGIGPEYVYKTNVLKYRPPNNDIKRYAETGHTVEEGLSELDAELRAFNPNLVLAVGGFALEALTGKKGITKWRGSLLQEPRTGKSLIPTIHPSSYLSDRGKGSLDYIYRAIFQFDVEKAARHIDNTRHYRKEKFVEICKDSIQLERFLERYKNEKVWALDIESSKCIPICIALSCTPSHAISIPLLQTLQFRNTGPVQHHQLVAIWRILARFLSDPSNKFIGQNLKYDYAKLRRPCGFILPDPYADTMFGMHALYPEFPASLAFQTSIFTDEPFYKDDGKEFILGKDDPETLMVYNGKDAAVNIEIWIEQQKLLAELGLTDFFHNHLMQMHPIYSDIEHVGIKLDFGVREGLWNKYAAKDRSIGEEMELLIGEEIDTNSPKKVGAVLFDKLKFPRRDSVDEDTLVALYGNHASTATKKRILELIIERRRVRKTMGTYISAMPDYDGRMRTSYRATGTETGRSSTTLLKPPIRIHKIGLAFQTITKHGEVGGDLRKMFVPDDGYCFLECDLSQAEARIVALLAEDYELLADFDRLDIHAKTASWFFGKDLIFEQALIDDPKSKGKKAVSSDERFIGKIGRHGGNYDMGKKRLMMEINSGAKRFDIRGSDGNTLSVSEWRAGQISDIFHSKSPKIRGVFHVLIQEAIDRDSTLINPFGRRRQFFGRRGHDLYKEAYATIPQGTVRDAVLRAMINVRKRIKGIKIVMESHDAFLTLAPLANKREYAEIIREEMSRPIDFERCTIPRGILVIPADLQVGYTNLKELQNYDPSKDS